MIEKPLSNRSRYLRVYSTGSGDSRRAAIGPREPADHGWPGAEWGLDHAEAALLDRRADGHRAGGGDRAGGPAECLRDLGRRDAAADLRKPRPRGRRSLLLPARRAGVVARFLHLRGDLHGPLAMLVVVGPGQAADDGRARGPRRLDWGSTFAKSSRGIACKFVSWTDRICGPANAFGHSWLPCWGACWLIASLPLYQDLARGGHPTRPRWTSRPAIGGSGR